MIGTPRSRAVGGLVLLGAVVALVVLTDGSDDDASPSIVVAGAAPTVGSSSPELSVNTTSATTAPSTPRPASARERGVPTYSPAYQS